MCERSSLIKMIVLQVRSLEKQAGFLYVKSGRSVRRKVI